MDSKEKKLAAEKIVELFESFLDEKGISVPCEDKDEEKERLKDSCAACLYGSEYYRLVNSVQKLL